MNLFEPFSYVRKIKYEHKLIYEDNLSEEKLRKQALTRAPNFLHKNGQIYASKPGEPYYAVTVSPLNKKFESQIEKNIFPLVKCFIEKNYLTVSSCEGHSLKEDPQVRVVFGSLESAEKFFNYFKDIKNLEITILEYSANVDQFLKNGKFHYSPKEIEKSSFQEVQDINRLFYRNYKKVFYVNLKIKNEKGIVNFFMNFLFPQKIEIYRLNKINELVEKAKNMDYYEL